MKRLEAIMDPKLIPYYSIEAEHEFVIGHENGHSLGPINGKAYMGSSGDIIEENKADMVSIAMLDYLVEKGKYSEEDKKKCPAPV